jgi:enoyl-CoA hydratase/carnithine racemase
MTERAEGQVRLERQAGVATVVFDRPHARNAMTWQMYDQLLQHCLTLKNDMEIRAVTFRGAGGASFIAGSDISQFREFTSAEEGVAYEAKMDEYLGALLSIPCPTIAVIEGFAVGGGLNIAACCDLRIATHGSKLGAPIARTIGNCLSLSNYSRLVAGFGEGRARRMMLLAEMLDAEEALSAGFLFKLCAPADLEDEIETTTQRLLGNAPLTLRASKAAINRALSGSPDGAEDLIRMCYGSDDFGEGVSAFLEKRTPLWRGC